MINLTSDSFDKALQENDIMIVDFWADWCGPCKKVAPILEEISNERSVTIGKVHVDEQQDLAIKYDISSIPAMVVFEKGVPVKKVIGAQPKHKLLQEFEEWI